MNPSEPTNDVHLMNQDAPAQSNLPTAEETNDYIQELRSQRNGLLDQVTALSAGIKGLERKLARVDAAFIAYKEEVEKSKEAQGAEVKKD